jgi:hypothetical protein
MLRTTVMPTSRLCYQVIPKIVCSSYSLVSNYLLPIFRGISTVGWRFVQTHVLPRFVAAAVAFIDPPGTRFQQRGPTVIIIPLVLSSVLPVSSVGPSNDQRTDDDNPPASFLFSDPLVSSVGYQALTSVTHLPVVDGPAFAGHSLC